MFAKSSTLRTLSLKAVFLANPPTKNHSLKLLRSFAAKAKTSPNQTTPKNSPSKNISRAFKSTKKPSIKKTVKPSLNNSVNVNKETTIHSEKTLNSSKNDINCSKNDINSSNMSKNDINSTNMSKNDINSTKKATTPLKTTEEASGAPYAQWAIDEKKAGVPANLKNFGFYAMLGMVFLWLLTRYDEKKNFKVASDAELMVATARSKELEALKRVTKLEEENLGLLKEKEALLMQIKNVSERGAKE